VSYENPEVPHEVNVARGNPVAEFLRLVGALLAVLLVCGAALYFAGEHFARRVPFALEQRWTGDRVVGFDGLLQRGPDARPEVEAYLQRLSDGLAATLPLPEGMRVRVHYADAGVPNAFATLGGHVVVTRGLLERMPSENALAMVLAHEIGHIRARDPIAALGGGASLALLLAAAGGDVGSLAPQAAMVIQRGYSRAAERQADEVALEALQRFYGHAGGAAEVFRRLGRESPFDARLPSMLATHPSDDERIARLEAAADGWDPALQPLRPLALPPAVTPTPPPRAATVAGP
jgi:Zn-dependent protease with chaperone function